MPRGRNNASPPKPSRPPRQRGGFCSCECPASFAKNESDRESESIHAEEFSVNSIARIVPADLSTQGSMFAQSSRFVRAERIVPRIKIDFGDKIFR
jgi:hypothetical protein